MVTLVETKRGDNLNQHCMEPINFHIYTSAFLKVPDFGEGGAPDAIGLHAAVEKLLLQTGPLGLGGADLCGGPGFSQLLALSGCSLHRGLRSPLFPQDAVLQVGAEFPHGLAQPGHEKH